MGRRDIALLAEGGNYTAGDDSGSVFVIDVTDPAKPVVLNRWLHEKGPGHHPIRYHHEAQFLDGDPSVMLVTDEDMHNGCGNAGGVVAVRLSRGPAPRTTELSEWFIPAGTPAPVCSVHVFSSSGEQGVLRLLQRGPAGRRLHAIPRLPRQAGEFIADGATSWGAHYAPRLRLRGRHEPRSRRAALGRLALKAILLGVPASHPTLAAQLMLEHKRIDYMRYDVVPALHRLLMQLAFPAGTVPGIVIDGQRFQGTRTISRALDVLVPEPPLFPEDPAKRADVEQAELWGDLVLQPAARRLSWAALSRDHSTIDTFLADAKLGLPTWLAVATAPPVVWMATKGNHVTAASTRRDLAALPRMLDRVDDLIERGVIANADPNAADFQIATSVRLLMAIDDLRDEIEQPSRRQARAAGGPGVRRTCAFRQVRGLACDCSIMEAATPLASRTSAPRATASSSTASSSTTSCAVRLVREREQAGEDTVKAVTRRDRDRRARARPRAGRRQRRVREDGVRAGLARARGRVHREGPQGRRALRQEGRRGLRARERARCQGARAALLRRQLGVGAEPRARARRPR